MCPSNFALVKESCFYVYVDVYVAECSVFALVAVVVQ